MIMPRRHKTLFKPYESTVINGEETPYLRITRTLYISDAFFDLTYLARIMYIDMRFAAGIRPEVQYTQKNAMDNLGICKASYKTAIELLVSTGFIERCPRSAYEPSRYKFSANWHHYRSKSRDILTDKIIRKKQNRKQPSKYSKTEK